MCCNRTVSTGKCNFCSFRAQETCLLSLKDLFANFSSRLFLRNLNRHKWDHCWLVAFRFILKVSWDQESFRLHLHTFCFLACWAQFEIILVKSSRRHIYRGEIKEIYILLFTTGSLVKRAWVHMEMAKFGILANPVSTDTET